MEQRRRLAAVKVARNKLLRKEEYVKVIIITKLIRLDIST